MPMIGPNARLAKLIAASERLTYPRAGVGIFTSNVRTVVSAISSATSAIIAGVKRRRICPLESRMDAALRSLRNSSPRRMRGASDYIIPARYQESKLPIASPEPLKHECRGSDEAPAFVRKGGGRI